MVWVRLADDFTDHPKVVEAGPLAGWLYVCGLSYSNRYATDGFIPSAQVRRLADVPNHEELASRLVKARLWEVADGGYQIHDYAAYQPSAEEVKRDREAAAKRQAEYRRRRAEARNAARNAEGDALLTRESQPPGPGPVPDPSRPVPELTSSPQPPPRAEGERPPTPRKRGARSSRRGANGSVAHDEAAAAVELTPVTAEDVRVWHLARGSITDLNAANFESVARLEPIGRAPDGGMHLRAPPGLVGMARFRPVVAKALFDAGDRAAERTTIVEGPATAPNGRANGAAHEHGEDSHSLRVPAATAGRD